MVNWKTLEAKDRLLAALVAAHPDKKLLDYRKIATFYGQGTTYDSVEGQFRIIRREAAKLREAVESGEQAPAPPRGGGATTGATPKSAKDSTLKATRGVSSSNNPSRSKKTANSGNVLITGGGSSVISGRVTKSFSPPKVRKSAPPQHQPLPLAGAMGLGAGMTAAAATMPTTTMSAADMENRLVAMKEDYTSSQGSTVEVCDGEMDFGGEQDAFGDTDWTVPFPFPNI